MNSPSLSKPENPPTAPPRPGAAGRSIHKVQERVSYPPEKYRRHTSNPKGPSEVAPPQKAEKFENRPLGPTTILQTVPLLHLSASVTCPHVCPHRLGDTIPSLC